MEVYDSRLELFDGDDDYFNQIKERYEVELQPISAPDDSAPIEFLIPADLDGFLDSSNIKLHIKGKVVKSDNKVLTDTDIVTPTNNFASSLFSHVEVDINGTLITNTSTSYPYKCYFENLINLDKETIRTKGQLQGFFGTPLDEGVNDVYDPKNGECLSVAKYLYGYAKNSKPLNLLVPLHLDLSRCGKLLPNLSQVRIKLNRNKPEFYLNYDASKGSYKYKIDKITLMFTKYKLGDDILMKYAKEIEQQSFSFKFPNVIVGSHTIAKDSISFELNDPFGGKVPDNFVFGFVTHEAFNGSAPHNPFYFQHNKLKSITTSVDDRPTPCGTKFFDFDNNDFLGAYNTILENLDMGGRRNPAVIINRNNYEEGFTILAYDFTANNGGGDMMQPVKSGIFKLSGSFNVKLPNNVQLVYYAVFSQKMFIDRSRNVSIIKE